MKRFVLILLFLKVFILFGQGEVQATVNTLNFDPFFEMDRLKTSPILPVLTPIEKIGFELSKKKGRKKNKDNYIHIFPVVDLLGAYNDASKEFSYNGGVGVGLIGQYSDKFFVRASFTGNYLHADKDINSTQQIYRTFFESNASGKNKFGLQPHLRLSFSPYKFLNIQAGIDQNFIGQGNRSMLLGDYTAPYPFVQLRTKIWNLELVNLYQFFKEQTPNERVLKFASTHFFNYYITPRLQFGVFESVVFAPKDTLLNRGFEVSYLNPFLFYRPTEYSLGSQDRLLIGLNTSYEFNRMIIYGQLTLDEFLLHELKERTRWWANKYGGQIGIKGKGKISDSTRFFWRTELNFARPFIYSHLDINTVYGNQGKPLAHPLGSNFVEVFTEFQIHLPSKFSIQSQFFFVQQGGFDEGEKVSYGKDVYIPYVYRPFDYGFRIGGNGKVNRFHFSVEPSYMLSKRINLKAFVRSGVEVNNRVTKNYKGYLFVFGGIKTDLWKERSFSF